MSNYLDNVPTSRGDSNWKKLRTNIGKQMHMARLKKVGIQTAKNVSDVVRIRNEMIEAVQPLIPLSVLGPAPGGANDVDSLAASVRSWDFDVFKVDRITNGQSLLFVGMVLFHEHDLLSLFKIDGSMLSRFLKGIAAAYRSENSYDRLPRSPRARISVSHAPRANLHAALQGP